MSDQNGHGEQPVSLAPKADEQPLVITQAQRRGGWVTSIPAKGVWPINDNVQVPSYRWVLIDNRSSTLPLYVGFDAPPINDTQRYDRKVPAGMSRIFNVGPPTQNRLFVYNDDGSTAVPAQIEVSMEPIVDFQQLPVGTSSSPQTMRLQDQASSQLASVLGTPGDNSGFGGLLTTASTTWLYNGSAFDRAYNNTQGTLLASAVRTSSTISATQTNYNARGVILFLNVTAASGTGGLQTTLYYVDPIANSGSGTVSALPTAITTVTERSYVFYPTTFSGIGSAIAQATGIPVPRAWYASVTHGDASGYTYSLGYAYIL